MTYVALLRGINVGGNNKVAMKDLKRAFEAMGFTDVQTYINSGNVIFIHKNTSIQTLATDIEKGIKKQLDLNLRIVVRTKDQIATVYKEIPKKWVNDAVFRTDILFLWDEVNKRDVLGEIAINPDVDKLLYVDGAVIWHFDRKHYKQSKMHKFIGTHVYKHMTARNANTVKKLCELMGGDV